MKKQGIHYVTFVVMILFCRISQVMKLNLMLITSFLCLVFVSRAQNPASYQSIFGDSCSVWYIFSVTDGNMAGGTDVRQVFTDDTMNEGGQTYKVLRHIDSESSYEIPVYNNEPQLLRENHSHSKLFFKENYPGLSVPEILIMDLDLEVGDTLNTRGWEELNFSGLETAIPTIRIDSVFNQNNRKILSTNLYHESWGGRKDTLFFIEGVGPSFGPYYPLQRDLKTLTCQYKDNVETYHGKDYLYYGNCVIGWPSGIAEQDGTPGCVVYPNPAHGTLHIQDLAGSLCHRVVIRNASGKVVYSLKSITENPAVDISHYPCGIYYVTLIGSNAAVTTKVVKL